MLGKLLGTIAKTAVTTAGCSNPVAGMLVSFVTNAVSDIAHAGNDDEDRNAMLLHLAGWLLQVAGVICEKCADGKITKAELAEIINEIAAVKD